MCFFKIIYFYIINNSNITAILKIIMNEFKVKFNIIEIKIHNLYSNN